MEVTNFETSVEENKGAVLVKDTGTGIPEEFVTADSFLLPGLVALG